jgi:outer membrane protein assembly factor BamB
MLLLAVTAPALQWTAEVGEGYSSPVVLEKVVCALGRKGNNEMVTCFDRTSGKVAWRDHYAAPFTKSQYATKMAPGPFSTPVAAQGTLFTLGASAHLRAYDIASGKLKWQRTPPMPVSTSRMFFGTAMTPFFDEKQNRLIVFWGDDGAGELVSLDPATGKTLWSFNGEHPVYSNIAVATIAGTRQYVTLGERHAFGVDPATGKLLWKVAFQDEYNENAVTPVVIGDVVILSAVRKPTAAYAISRTAGGWEAKQKWSNADMPMYLSNPVLVGDRLYGLSSRGKGTLFALDARTGKTLYKSEGRYAENAQFLVEGQKLYAMTTQGEWITLDISGAAPVERARFEAAKTQVWAKPALSGRQLFIKDETSLRAFGLP